MLRAFWQEEYVLNQLAQQGFVVIDNVFGKELAKKIITAWGDESQLRPAEIGRSIQQQRISEVRGDFIRWLDPAETPPDLQSLWQQLAAMQLSFKQAFFLPINYFEAHLAMYPPGGFYKRHLDQFEATNFRQITCIFYLNENWTQADGGQLRIYTSTSTFVDIYPLLGRAVLFKSAEVWHEVLPALRKRYSLTGWFCVLPMEEQFLAG